MKDYSNQSGQIVIVILLITLVALSVGLAITQRSLTNVATSTQNEQSSRAFSAADAGIERALQQDASISEFNIGDATAQVIKSVLPNPNQALEYPPIGKETIAQFWLANPDNFSDPLYNNPSVDIYFGKSDLALSAPDSPALEINAITFDSNTNSYTSNRFYIDSSQASGRAPGNGFSLANNCSNVSQINTSSSPDTTINDRKFRCRHTLSLNPSGSSNIKPVMIRARILYSNLNHPIAVDPIGQNSLPQQASIFKSTGTAGQSQKSIQVFRLKYVVPNFFEFSIFTSGDLRKEGQ